MIMRVNNRHRILVANLFEIRRYRSCLVLVMTILLGLVSPTYSKGLPTELPDFAALVKQNKAAVVNISIDEAIRDPRENSPQDDGDGGSQSDEESEDKDLSDFLREFQDELPAFRTESLGSGFVLTEDGYILTCAHVIEDASRVVVRFSDRKEYEATVVGKDKRSDVAVLKVDAEGLATVDIGDPASLDVGEWVLAIGSPFGFDSSATSGIVSAKGRSLPNESYVPFIQTDVAINPGNSGGPLFDLDGKVVGINAQIYSRTGGFMGLSFAVPIDLAIRVSDQLRENGRVKRGWLGVSIQEVTAELADSLNMNVPTGALIEKILEQSPAAQSDLVAGDVIVAFNGVGIGKMSDLPPVVGSTLAGSTVPLNVVRDGQTIQLDVTLGELPSETTIASVPADPAVQDEPDSEQRESEDEQNVLGMLLESPEPGERETLDLPDGGLVVRSIASGSGMRSGLKEGDLILRLGDTDILELGQFQALIDELASNPASDDRDDSQLSTPLLIRRGTRSLFLALKIESDQPAE